MDRQIACADVLLLNKTDLVDDETIQKVEPAIRYARPTAAHNTFVADKQEYKPYHADTSHSAVSDTAPGHVQHPELFRYIARRVRSASMAATAPEWRLFSRSDAWSILRGNVRRSTTTA